MEVQKIQWNVNQFNWIVVDNNSLPIKPIQLFLKYQHNIGRSPNTLRAYANHLKLYWEYLEYINKPWTDVSLNDFANFIGWLRTGNSKLVYLQKQKFCRMGSTINTILTVVSVFYEFHNQIQNTEIKLTSLSKIKHSNYKPFLYHISKHQPIKTKLIKLKTYKQLPKTLDNKQVTIIIAACKNLRDRFLISLLYETGMRIGQALGLQHNDIKSWDNEINIQPRDNINGARCKSKTPYIVHVSQELMRLYSEYVLQECKNHIQNYVFIQLKGNNIGKPLNYIAIRNTFLQISKKVGFSVNPHMFRHTHATELLRHGWDCDKVKKRLGHTSIQTTLNVYSHLNTQDLKEAFISYQINKGEK